MTARPVTISPVPRSVDDVACSRLTPPPPLTGNKCDMDDHEIKPEETEALMDAYPEIFAFIETSAKENRKVEEPFLRLAKVLVVSRNGMARDGTVRDGTGRDRCTTRTTQRSEVGYIGLTELSAPCRM